MLLRIENVKKRKSFKKKLNEIASKIQKLKDKKEKLIENQKEKRYCPHCNKMYPQSKIKSWLEFSKGGFLESIWVKCPKGHEWDEK